MGVEWRCDGGHDSEGMCDRGYMMVKGVVVGAHDGEGRCGEAHGCEEMWGGGHDSEGM
jgi:hypothetical protein